MYQCFCVYNCIFNSFSNWQNPTYFQNLAEMRPVTLPNSITPGSLPFSGALLSAHPAPAMGPMLIHIFICLKSICCTMPPKGQAQDPGYMLAWGLWIAWGANLRMGRGMHEGNTLKM